MISRKISGKKYKGESMDVNIDNAEVRAFIERPAFQQVFQFFKGMSDDEMRRYAENAYYDSSLRKIDFSKKEVINAFNISDGAYEALVERVHQSPITAGELHNIFRL